jgi:hypothetical protein
MKDPAVTWSSTFPDCEPDTDGVAIVEDRIGREGAGDHRFRSP